ncbi:MAG: PP2C family serine/threonine-protein phosphatase [Planktothrix sp.]|uniref:PP2C family serine/threonine-protein phosphatase n=1 Tax=Planktothrix sp. TaxID=3088171 RepID=UPI0038D4F736
MNSIGFWQVISASVTGKSHEKQNIPCQDAQGYKRLSDHQLIFAVADGAGSSKLSDLGANLAVKMALITLEEKITMGVQDAEILPWQDYLKAALTAAKTAIEAEAVTQETEIRELATTLILGIATPELVAVAQVGDGAIVVEDKTGNILELTIPTSGEYLNETVFLIAPNAIETAQINLWKGQPKYLAAFSDGLQMLALKMPEGKPHHPFFSPLFKFVESITDETDAKKQLMGFLRSPRVTERTDDDLTLILASFNS